MAEGPHVCGRGDQRYCCSGWRTRKGSNVCNVPVCTANQCGDGICTSPMMCYCPDGKNKKSCNENEFVEEESRLGSGKFHFSMNVRKKNNNFARI